MTNSGRGLLAWLDQPSPDRGIRFAGPDDSWDFWTYETLARHARRFARSLLEAGVPQGGGVAIVLRSGPDFVAALFGSMLAGAVPTPVAPPLSFQDPELYADHVVGLLATACPSVSVTEADLLGRVTEIAKVAGVRRTVAVGDLLVDYADGPDRRPPADLALLQFTSGSSGRARGVRVPFEALEANVQAIRVWLDMGEEDATASWLPVHHDMGLIGCLVTPVVNRSDLWLLSPEQFVHRPARYLQCFGVRGARLTAMPSFGLAYIVRRVAPGALEDFDFSAWRAVIVGAERLQPSVFERFLALCSPHGLHREALLPAYGLAEATLAVTGLPLEEPWTSVEAEAGSLALDRAVTPAAAGSGQVVVGCGRPLVGTSITVIDEKGRLAPDGHVGEIVVHGPSVAAGYAASGASASMTQFTGGALRSGDAGFVIDGQLYVLGRIGDSLKVRGRSLFAEDVEASLVSEGFAPNRIAVLLGARDGRPTAVAVLEATDDERLKQAENCVRRLAEGADVVVLDAPRGAITRTSSGKPKRRLLWQAFLEGRLPRRLAPPAPVIAGTTGGSHD